MNTHSEKRQDAMAGNIADNTSTATSPPTSHSSLDTEEKTAASVTGPNEYSAREQRHSLTSKVVTTAKFPSQKYRSEHNVFQRIGMHGGPITVASIRFPSPSPSFLRKHLHEDGGNDENIERSHGKLDTDCKLERKNSLYHVLRSQGRVVFARGPWIESHILFPKKGKEEPCVDDDDDGIKEESSSNLKNFRNGPIEVKTYKILAFGENNDGGNSTFEGVNGMVFPSSSSDLSSVKDFHAESLHEKSVRNEKRWKLSNLASIVAYGGRRLGFLSGGGLWNSSHNNNNDLGCFNSNAGDDEFATIPICKSRNKGKEAYASYLEVSDWIHDARVLDRDWNQSQACSTNQSGPEYAFLVALGMANNFCEIWGFHSVAPHPDMSLKYTNTQVDDNVALVPTILQCITCDVRCMTYSISFFGWNQSDESGVNNSHPLPSLVTASGTVFGEILVWGAVSNEAKGSRLNSDVKDENCLNETARKWFSSIGGIEDSAKRLRSGSIFETSTRRVSPSHRLKGHLGSIFSLKFWKNGIYIASASDDRSVRLWKLTDLGNSYGDNTNLEDDNKQSKDFIVNPQSSHSYTLIWTGWGHTARVWNVAFASFQSNAGESIPILISAGEDSTARVWSPLTSEKEIAHPLRGHRCESLWSVDECEGIIVTGGNDGCVKLWDLESRLRKLGTCTASDNLKKGIVTLSVPNDSLVQSASTPDPNQEKEFYTSDLDKDVHQTDSISFAKKQKFAPKKKSNSKGQIICGIEFFSDKNGKVANKLLIVTRGGGCFSLDLVLQSWAIHNNWDQSVFSLDDGKVIDLDPSMGSCVGVHPSGRQALVGTTEGWIVMASLSKNRDVHNLAFNRPSYRPAQSMSWIDNNNFLVFCARGSVIWWQLDSAQYLSPKTTPKVLCIMTLGTAGIPLCHAFDSERNNMFIGDSRGNIAFFNLNRVFASDDNQRAAQNPDRILSRVHDKEHVTGITILKKSGVVLSVGNDGCIHHSRVDHGDLKKLTRIPIPNVTGLRHIWNVRQPNGGESAVIGGYCGNDFLVFDSFLGYEFLRISTGGRQRRQDLFFTFADYSRRGPFLYGAAVVVGHKDGSNSIDFHFSHQFNDYISDLDCIWQTHDIKEFYSIGPSAHAEKVNDACWVECGRESIYLLTGSNDCLIKLSKFENDRFISVAELPPHESCVRGVCSSRHKDSSVSLIVTCGGKLSMEFYLLDHQVIQTSGGCKPSINSNVAFLCSYRTLAKSTIDHRMNVVRAIPLLPADSRCHLCLAGDSDGVLHLVVISELGNSRGTTIGNLISYSGRPILCIDLLRCRDRILAFVGTTSGDISVWDFPGTSILKDGNCSPDCLEGKVPNRPVFVFKAHKAGVNDLSVGSLPISSAPMNFCVYISSVSDDQTISICALYISVHSSQLCLKTSFLTVLQRASFSPLKSIKLVLDQSTFHQIYVSGHDEQISLFKLGTTENQQPWIKFVSSSPIGTDGSCLACFHFKKQGCPTRLIGSVGGDGIEIFSLDFEILHAAKALTEANYLLITAGK
ncbi:hypothetical protein ACHAXS_013805 [Conticribra weissflogii]